MDAWVWVSAASVQGVTRNNLTYFVNNYKVSSSFGMMLGMSILFLVLTWYLDNVLPSEYGVPKSPFFLFMPCTCGGQGVEIHRTFLPV